MLRVLVFDSGWGGELIGDYIAEELPVEVIKLIDWRNGPYSEKSAGEIRLLADMALSRHIGEVDVIVLAETAVWMAAGEYLKERYPEQIFVGYGRGLGKMMRRLREVMILTTDGVRRLADYQREKAAFGRTRVIEPECRGWPKKIDDGELTDTNIEEAMGGYRGTIVIYSTAYIDVEPKIKELAGWGSRVVDMKKSLLRDVCAALKLKGVDGRLAREQFPLL